MKIENIILGALLSILMVNCSGGKNNKSNGEEIQGDSTANTKAVNEMAPMSVEKVLRTIPKNLTADSLARTLFYVLDSVKVQFSEASIELATTHATTADGSASILVVSYEGSNERERSGTTTYNFISPDKKPDKNSTENLESFRKTFNINNLAEAEGRWGIFKRRKINILASVDFTSDLIQAIKDAADTKQKINDLKNEKCKLDNIEVELSFLVTNDHEGKLEFKLWDKLGLGGSLKVENSYEHKLKIKFK